MENVYNAKNKRKNYFPPVHSNARTHKCTHTQNSRTEMKLFINVSLRGVGVGVRACGERESECLLVCIFVRATLKIIRVRINLIDIGDILSAAPKFYVRA